MKIKTINKFVNKYGREFKAGEIHIMFSDDAKAAIDAGNAVCLDGTYKYKIKKTKFKHKEDK